ncbi:ferredoxin family protein [Candidatus Sumerlaeota bacterium]|nr:ferredoxin family protein [Candidatus Sumerlaeota bacterium]
MTAAATSLRVVLYEGAECRRLEPARRAEILSALLKKGYAVTCRTDESGAVAPADGSDLFILGEFENGSAPEADDAAGRVRMKFHNIAAAPPDAIAAAADQFRAETQSGRAPGEWKPWFPVIDYDRCTNCMQCLSFCLFDVYSVDDEKKIQVKNEEKCKTNCPACSRVCPEVAILFPKYRSGPINGDAVNAQDVEREKMKIDVSALLGGDIYSMLRDRHARANTRFSKERDEKQALQERMKCLQQLQDQMDIPPEVLLALPSLDEIRFKAEQAAKRAEEALKGRGGLK